MEWYVIISIVKSIVGGIFGGFYFYLAHRLKLNLRKPRVFISGAIALICVLQAITFISEKYDFRGKWDAYQFRKTMIGADAFQKPIEPPTELSN